MRRPKPGPDREAAAPGLEGKGVIVTGGTTGIGRAIAGNLATHGAQVFIFGRHKTELNDTLRSFDGASGRIDGMVADVASKKDIDAVFRRARKKLTRLDILVANAGLGGEGIADMPDADWRYVVETNLVGAMASARAAVVWMEEAGSGHIVIIGSMSAERKGKDSSVYVATKSALRGFSESLHKEVRESGIKVTLIEPGRVGSDMIDETPATQRKKIRRGEMLSAEDIAAATYYTVTQPARCDVTFMQIRPHIEAP
jgi:NADP-dependent 3-hydroxy acid dehydrogenase YdfG